MCGTIVPNSTKFINAAVVVALNNMCALVMTQFGLERKDALALISVTADVRISQLVNGVRGVHVVLPHGAIEEEEWQGG